MNIKLILPTLLMLVAVLAFGFTSKKAVEPQDKVNWVSIEEAEKMAAEDGKKILIDFYTDWCGWCKKMDKTTYADAKVVAYLNENFHSVKFDAEQKEDVLIKDRTYKFVASGRRGYHELAGEILGGRMSYPSTSFLDNELGIITNLPGFQKADFMLGVLHFINEEAYKENIPFDKYYEEFQAR